MIEPGSLICPTCARPTPPGADFCPECTAPLTAHSVYDPFDTIKTTGFLYRQASQRPKAPIVVVGIVMLLGPMFLGSAYSLVAVCYEIYLYPQQFEWWSILFLALFGGVFYISGSILLRTFENFENRPADDDAAKRTGDDDEEKAEAWWDEATDDPGAGEASGKRE